MKRQALLFVVLASLLGTTLAFGGSYWGRGGSGGGGGSGTVTSIATTGPLSGGTITTTGTLSCPTCTTSVGMTTGLFPVASGAHALVNSVFGQDTSALVAAGSTAAVGGIGFNQAGNVEVIADGSTVVNAGLFAGTASDFTLHDSTTQNNFQFLMYNDGDGITNGIVLSNYGASPSNEFQFTFGDGAGGFATLVKLSKDHEVFLATNFQFGAVGSNAITSPSGGFVAFNVGGATTAPNGFSHTFIVTGNTDADVLLLLQKDGTQNFSQISTANNAVTVMGGLKVEVIGNPASSTKLAATMEVDDSAAGGGDVSMNLFSPTNNSIVSGVGTFSLNTTQVASGTAPYFYFAVPGGATGFAIHAPDAMAGGATKLFTWPADKPSVTGQPLVATNASPSVFSFAVGATIGAADVTVVGHYLSSTTTPAVTNTTANSCGTTAATIVGTDVAGKVTVGATAGTSCTVTFTTAFANAPACTVTNETTANLSRATSTQTTVILAGTFVAGDKLAYICIGRV